MTTQETRTGEVTVVDNGLYIVSTWDWYEHLDFTPATPLATPSGPMVALHPGLNTGPVLIRTMFTTQAPEVLDAGLDERAWEDVVEVSAHFPETPVSVVTTVEGSIEDITAGRAGDFRLRVHAFGREEARDGTSETATEQYLIQLWPAPPSPPRVLVTAVTGNAPD